MIIQGKAWWTKVLGSPVDNYAKDGKEWTFDLSLDKTAKKRLEEANLGEKIKNKGDDRGDFITFKRNGHKPDGTMNNPIPVVDAHTNAWDDDVKIGNGSTINVKFNVNEYEGRGAGKGKMFYRPIPFKIQVVDLVPYEGGDNEDFDTVEGGTKIEEWT